MKKRCLILMFLLPILPSISQERTVNAKERFETCETLLTSGQPDTLKFKEIIAGKKSANAPSSIVSLNCLQNAIELTNRQGNLQWRAKLYKVIGLLYNTKAQKDSAIVFYNLALADFQTVNNIKGEVEIYDLLTITHASNDSSDKAYKYGKMAVAIHKKMGNELGLAKSYLNICYNFLNFNEEQAAAEAAEKALKIYRKIGNKKEEVYALLSYSSCYSSTNPEHAFEIICSAEKIVEEENLSSISVLLDVYFSKAKSLAGLKRYAEVEQTLNKLDDLTKNQRGLEANRRFNHYKAVLGLINQEKYQEAKNILRKEVSHPMAAENSMNTYNLHHLSKCYASLGQLDSAYIFLDKSIVEGQAIRFHDSQKNMLALKTKYETEKKEATILVQKEQLQQQKMIQFLSIGLAGVFCVLFLQIYQSSKKRKITNKNLAKVNTLLNKKNQQNELLLKEIHHRVKNNLETVSSLLALQSATIEDPTVLDAMLESQNRVQSMGMIHQKLYQGENLASIEMKDYFLNLSEGILDSFGAEGRVQVECAMQKLELDVDTAVPIGLIVNELLTNSLKYAFPDGQNGKISISLKEKNADNLELTISDNGIGKNTISAQKSKGFGTQLIQLLTTQINGTLEEIVNQGTMVSLTFKRSNLA